MKRSAQIGVGSGLAAVALAFSAGMSGLPAQSATVDASGDLGSTYIQSFDTADSLDDLVFELADGRPFDDKGQTYQGDHGLPDANGSCGNPNTDSRTVSAPSGRTSPSPSRFDNAAVRASGVVYWCTNGKQHFMTAINTKGYAHLDFRPDRVFTDPVKACWDQNITAMGGKWTEATFVPIATFNANGQRMDYTNPQRNGDGKPGGWGLQITDGVVKGTYLGTSMFGSINQGVDKSGQDYSTTEDRAMRTQHCMTDNENGTITMKRGRADGSTQSHTFAGSFPSGQSVFILSDVGYNPFKRDGNEGETTWHWDNLLISSDSSAQGPSSGTPTAPQPGATTQPPTSGQSTTQQPQTPAPEPKRYALATRLG